MEYRRLTRSEVCVYVNNTFRQRSSLNLQTFPPVTWGLGGGEPSNEDLPPVAAPRGMPPLDELMGPEICFGAEMAGFLDLFAFLSEIPLLSDILRVLSFGVGSCSLLSQMDL